MAQPRLLTAIQPQKQGAGHPVLGLGLLAITEVLLALNWWPLSVATFCCFSGWALGTKSPLVVALTAPMPGTPGLQQRANPSAVPTGVPAALGCVLLPTWCPCCAGTDCPQVSLCLIRSARPPTHPCAADGGNIDLISPFLPAQPDQPLQPGSLLLPREVCGFFFPSWPSLPPPAQPSARHKAPNAS